MSQPKSWLRSSKDLPFKLKIYGRSLITNPGRKKKEQSRFNPSIRLMISLLIISRMRGIVFSSWMQLAVLSQPSLNSQR